MNKESSRDHRRTTETENLESYFRQNIQPPIGDVSRNPASSLSEDGKPTVVLPFGEGYQVVADMNSDRLVSSFAGGDVSSEDVSAQTGVSAYIDTKVSSLSTILPDKYVTRTSLKKIDGVSLSFPLLPETETCTWIERENTRTDLLWKQRLREAYGIRPVVPTETPFEDAVTKITSLEQLAALREKQMVDGSDSQVVLEDINSDSLISSFASGSSSSGRSSNDSPSGYDEFAGKRSYATKDLSDSVLLRTEDQFNVIRQRTKEEEDAALTSDTVHDTVPQRHVDQLTKMESVERELQTLRREHTQNVEQRMAKLEEKVDFIIRHLLRH